MIRVLRGAKPTLLRLHDALTPPIPYPYYPLQMHGFAAYSLVRLDDAITKLPLQANVAVNTTLYYDVVISVHYRFMPCIYGD